jgi:hypothetical protein
MENATRSTFGGVTTQALDTLNINTIDHNPSCLANSYDSERT